MTDCTECTGRCQNGTIWISVHALPAWVFPENANAVHLHAILPQIAGMMARLFSICDLVGPFSVCSGCMPFVGQPGVEPEIVIYYVRQCAKGRHPKGECLIMSCIHTEIAVNDVGLDAWS